MPIQEVGTGLTPLYNFDNGFRKFARSQSARNEMLPTTGWALKSVQLILY